MEKVNLVDKYPDIVTEMKKKLQFYKDQASPEYIYLFIINRNPDKRDPASDPSNFDGVWTPWGGI